MTPKEASKAAIRCLPVISNDIEYKRICQTGYNYDEQGRWTPFVALQDKRANSITYTDPARVSLVDPDALNDPLEKKEET